MHPFPHHYAVAFTLEPGPEPVALTSPGLPPLVTATPPEFDGPPGSWSPETLLVAAVVDCFALTFRGIARASRLAWTRLAVECVGRLERPDRISQFTRFHLVARLTLPEEGRDDLARRVLTRPRRPVS
jgi:organic hydroperoxide reductase OsmC/OhrA